MYTDRDILIKYMHVRHTQEYPYQSTITRYVCKCKLYHSCVTESAILETFGTYCILFMFSTHSNVFRTLYTKVGAFRHIGIHNNWDFPTPLSVLYCPVYTPTCVGFTHRLTYCVCTVVTLHLCTNVIQRQSFTVCTILY
jgi:hypothetical protein